MPPALTFPSLCRTKTEKEVKGGVSDSVFTDFPWAMVRDRRFLGLKFRRQHQVGSYAVDFYCDEHKLVIGLVGAIHNVRKEKDQKRDRYLKSQGFRVLRIKNEDFLTTPQAALEQMGDFVEDAIKLYEQMSDEKWS